MEHDKTALSKTVVLLVVIYCTFFLGRYSVLFNGSEWAWIVVVGGLVAVGLGTSSLLWGFWRTRSTRIGSG
jgi:protein-S-isoprenylcysteine O-methyltransferase Ste14